MSLWKSLSNTLYPHPLLSSTLVVKTAKPLQGSSTLLPTQTFYVKFEGRLRPDYVSLFRIRHPVEPWYKPIKICFSSFIFRHVASQWKSRPKCIRCGKKKHANDEVCRRQDLPPICANCSGGHLPTDRTCPAFLHEKAIQAIAAKRNITPLESRLLVDHPPTKPCPSTITLTQEHFPPLPQTSAVASPLPAGPTGQTVPTGYNRMVSSSVSSALPSGFWQPSGSGAGSSVSPLPQASPIATSQHALSKHTCSLTQTPNSILATRAAHHNALLASHGQYPRSSRARNLAHHPTGSAHPPPLPIPPPHPPNLNPPPDQTAILNNIISILLQLITRQLIPALPPEGSSEKLAPVIASLINLLDFFPSQIHHGQS